MKTQHSFDFDKEEIIWFDAAYAFGLKEKKDQKHGFPATSRGPVLAYSILAAIVILAVLLEALFG